MAGSTQRPGGIIEGINVTPLVDIVLVLLVIFIVTAKFVVAPAVPTDLPRSSQAQAIQTIFAVNLAADGALSLDGAPVKPAEIEARARAALARDPGLRAVIQADGGVAHRHVIATMDLLSRAGLERVAFGALPPEGPAPGAEAQPTTP